MTVAEPSFAIRVRGAWLEISAGWYKIWEQHPRIHNAIDTSICASEAGDIYVLHGHGSEDLAEVSAVLGTSNVAVILASGRLGADLATIEIASSLDGAPLVRAASAVAAFNQGVFDFVPSGIRVRDGTGVSLIRLHFDDETEVWRADVAD